MIITQQGKLIRLEAGLFARPGAARRACDSSRPTPVIKSRARRWLKPRLRKKQNA